VKFIFGAILVAIALYLVLDQCGGITATMERINNGKAAATLRGY